MKDNSINEPSNECSYVYAIDKWSEFLLYYVRNKVDDRVIKFNFCPYCGEELGGTNERKEMVEIPFEMIEKGK